jgi:hypothetical protein
MSPDLEREVDAALVATIPDSVRRWVERLVASGVPPAEVLARVKALAGGRRTGVILAIEALLGARQDGTFPEG